MPFSPEELMARVAAVMRLTYREADVFSPLLRLSDLEIDILNRRVRVGPSELHFTSLELSLLYLLADSDGCLLTRDTHSRPTLGCRLRSREQRGRPPYPEPAPQTAEPFRADALHRHGPWPRISLLVSVSGRGVTLLDGTPRRCAEATPRPEIVDFVRATIPATSSAGGSLCHPIHRLPVWPSSSTPRPATWTQVRSPTSETVIPADAHRTAPSTSAVRAEAGEGGEGDGIRGSGVTGWR